MLERYVVSFVGASVLLLYVGFLGLVLLCVSREQTALDRAQAGLDDLLAHPDDISREEFAGRLVGRR